MRLFFYCSIIASSRSVTLGKVAGQALGIGVVFNRRIGVNQKKGSVQFL